jgi:hypothetical protein
VHNILLRQSASHGSNIQAKELIKSLINLIIMPLGLPESDIDENIDRKSKFRRLLGDRISQ